MVGMGRGAENGILFRNSAALEKAAEITTAVFDKTGTLTQGSPRVTDVIVTDAARVDESALLRLAASAEKGSEHPLAHALVQAAETRQIKLAPVEKFVAVPGKGLNALVDSRQIGVGNLALMRQLGIVIDDLASQKLATLQDAGKTAMFVAVDGVLAGLIAMSDTIKASSAQAVAELNRRGVQTIMLTGDNARSAQAIAAQAGVSDVIADVLPEQKAAKILQLQGAAGRKPVIAMIGDGINDAPALAQADVGMAIGTGTDIAIEAADVTLISGDIGKVIQAIGLSRLTVRGIRQNLFWALIYNVVLIPTAVFGVFQTYGPILAAAAMAMSSLFVVGNSLRLRKAALA